MCRQLPQPALRSRDGAGLAAARVLGDDEVEGVAHAHDDEEVAPLLGRDEAGLDELRQRLVLLAQHDATALVADALLDEHLAVKLGSQQRAQGGGAGMRRLEEQQPDLAAEDGHRVPGVGAASARPTRLA